MLIPPYEVFKVHSIEETPSRIFLSSVFGDDFVERYILDGNAVGEAEALVKKYKN